jgi:hypothetical protein
MRWSVLVLSVMLAFQAQAGTVRSAAARAAFIRANPCPITGQARGACPGYVVDHVKALACGGVDHQANMQWQTVPDAKANDKWERKECGK